MYSLPVTFSNGGDYWVWCTATFDTGGNTGMASTYVSGGQSKTINCDNFVSNLRLACTFYGIFSSTTILFPGNIVFSPHYPLTVELYGLWPGTPDMKVEPSAGVAATFRRSRTWGRGLAARKSRGA